MSLAEFIENYQQPEGSPYHETWVSPEESPTDEHGFFCNICARDVTNAGCPDHAPTEFPGLRLAECSATPRHLIFDHERDDYGFPCPVCQMRQLDELIVKLRWCKHRAWRRWRISHRVAGLLGRFAGLSGYGSSWGDGCKTCLLTDGMRFRWWPR